MALTFAPVIARAGIKPAEALVIRHAYVREHEDGTAGIHGDSSEAEITAYTRDQSASTRISRRRLPRSGSSSSRRWRPRTAVGRAPQQRRDIVRRAAAHV